jgi:hypothetical protein
MLTRPLIRLAAGLLTGLLVQAFTSVAYAAPSGSCSDLGLCYVEDIRPAVPSQLETTPASAPNEAQAPSCTDSTGAGIPCYVEGLGWYEQSSHCYLKVMDPQPPPGSPLWAGHTPAEGGALYSANCGVQAGGSLGTSATSVVWRRGPPIALIDPAVVAERAIASMQLQPPLIRTAPPQGSRSGLVGLPVWMWTERAENVSGPITRSASEGAVSVEATGVVSVITWDMGDGTTVTCGLGTPHAPSVTGPSPDCGHVYTRASTNHEPGTDRWPIRATTTWTVTWIGGGQSGTETVELSSTAELLVGELQVLNQDGSA